MAQLTPIPIVFAGTLQSLSAVNASDKVKVPTDQRLFLHVKNGGGGSINVTIPKVQASINHPEAGLVTLADMVVAVAAGAEKLIGPIPPAYVDAAGDATFNYSGTTSVTATAFTLPKVG